MRGKSLNIPRLSCEVYCIYLGSNFAECSHDARYPAPICSVLLILGAITPASATFEQELSYEAREAEIEREDGEVLLMVDTDVEKSGAHVHQYKLAADGVVTLPPRTSLNVNRLFW